MNLAHVLADGAAQHPERTALLFEDERISYRELDRRVTVAAAALRAQGVGAGDRVAIRLPNTPDYVAAYFGVLRLGAIAVPLNVLLAQPEIDARLESATPRAFVDRPLPRDGEPRVEIAERDEDDPAALLFTSGTTGWPKGAILTHAGIRAAARLSALGHSRLLAGPGGHGRGNRYGRLALDGRPRLPRRGRRPLPRRPQEGDDHSSGYNLYPREVEEVLYEHPAVLEAAVVGVPTSPWVKRSPRSSFRALVPRST